MKLASFTSKLILSALLAVAGLANGQTYPGKPVRFIVPQPPGGTTDILARMIGQRLSLDWGQSVVIDNRGGAGQIIGTEAMVKATPNGYTIGMVISTHAVNPSLYKKIPYDAVRDFAPVTHVAWVTDIVVLQLSLPAKTFKEFIALAKSKSMPISYGSAGNGTSTHLAGELFKQMTGADMMHVPFKGGAQATIGLLSGEVSMMFANFTSMLPNVKAGKVRALAVTSAKRNVATPDLPTAAEAGLPGFEVSEWFGIVAPAGTPKEIVTKINADVVQILARADMRDQLLSQGIEPVGSGHEQFGSLIKSEMVKWARVIKQAGITAD